MTTTMLIDQVFSSEKPVQGQVVVLPLFFFFLERRAFPSFNISVPLGKKPQLVTSELQSFTGLCLYQRVHSQQTPVPLPLVFKVKCAAEQRLVPKESCTALLHVRPTFMGLGTQFLHSGLHFSIRWELRYSFL